MIRHQPHSPKFNIDMKIKDGIFDFAIFYCALSNYYFLLDGLKSIFIGYFKAQSHKNVNLYLKYLTNRRKVWI